MDNYSFLFTNATKVLLPVVDFGYDPLKQQFEITSNFPVGAYSTWSGVYFQLLDGGTLPFILELDSGYGIVERTVTFVADSYHEAVSNDGFKVVQFIVETDNIDYVFTDVDAAALIGVYQEYGETTLDIFARIEEFATVDTLVLI